MKGVRAALPPLTQSLSEGPEGSFRALDSPAPRRVALGPHIHEPQNPQHGTRIGLERLSDAALTA